MEFLDRLSETSPVLPSICLNSRLPVAMPFASLTFASAAPNSAGDFCGLLGQPQCPGAGGGPSNTFPLRMELPDFKDWHLGEISSHYFCQDVLSTPCLSAWQFLPTVLVSVSSPKSFLSPFLPALISLPASALPLCSSYVFLTLRGKFLVYPFKV